MHKGEKLFLYLAGISGALLLAMEWFRIERPSLPVFFVVPILFLIYVLLSPGTFFVDARLAGRFACALFAGIALQFFFSRATPKILLTECLTFLITLSLGATYAAFFAPEMFADRLTLTYGNPHRLAVAGAFSIFTLFTFLNLFPKKKRPIVYCLFVLIGIAIFLTVSRSTIVGLLCAIAAYVLFYHAKHLIKSVVIASFLGIIAFSILPEAQQQRVLDPLTNPLNDNTIQQRIGIWYTALQGIKEAPIIGHGLRAYSDYDQQYKTEHYAEMTRKNIRIVDRRWAHPHSLYLGSLFGWGIIGTLLLIFTFIPALRYSSGNIKVFLILMTCFNLGYGGTELRIKSDDGAFMLFFPLGLAYGSILLQHLSQKLGSIPAPPLSSNSFITKVSNTIRQYA
ncbi:O-antigen ligase family protein [Halodesulfovibrio aestuarii]|uniref:O-antigen ligase family protein n=1 Tax=Halodesulfovibrio aestuarii TaxID=126333 RepID=UPI003D356B60